MKGVDLVQTHHTTGCSHTQQSTRVCAADFYNKPGGIFFNLFEFSACIYFQQHYNSRKF